MKNKSSKLLATFMLLITITAIIPCIAHAESGFELIESPGGNTLVVHNEVPGKLDETLKNRYKFGTYERIKISGKMNISDFAKLVLSSFKCRSIDLYEVDAKSIPYNSFCGLYNLEKFVCPHNLETIERQNFISCLSLKTVVLPETLKYIGNQCFMYCKNLELTVPESVEIGCNISCESTSSFCGSPNISVMNMPFTEMETKLTEEYSEKREIRCKSLFSYFASFLK